MATEFKASIDRYMEASPCEDGVNQALSQFGTTSTYGTLLSVEDIWISNGIRDAIWSLRVFPEREMEIRLFACACARLLLPFWYRHFPGNNTPLDAINTAKSYAYGEVDADALTASRSKVEEEDKKITWFATMEVAAEALRVAKSTTHRTASEAAAETSSTVEWVLGSPLLDRLFRKLLGGGFI